MLRLHDRGLPSVVDPCGGRYIVVRMGYPRDEDMEAEPSTTSVVYVVVFTCFSFSFSLMLPLLVTLWGQFGGALFTPDEPAAPRFSTGVRDPHPLIKGTLMTGH